MSLRDQVLRVLSKHETERNPDHSHDPRRRHRSINGDAAIQEEERNQGGTIENPGEIIKSVKDKLVGDANIVIISNGEGYNFRVGDSEFIAVGDFDSQSERVRLFNGAFKDETVLKGVVAHELSHLIFSRVQKKLSEEMSAVNRLVMDYTENSDPFAKNGVMSAEGTLRDEYKKRFPYYDALYDYFYGKHYKELKEKDGITPYSASYWKAHEQGNGSWDTAINETLAEISRLKAQGIKKGIPNIWRGFYREMNSLYKKTK